MSEIYGKYQDSLFDADFVAEDTAKNDNGNVVYCRYTSDIPGTATMTGGRFRAYRRQWCVDNLGENKRFQFLGFVDTLPPLAWDIRGKTEPAKFVINYSVNPFSRERLLRAG